MSFIVAGMVIVFRDVFPWNAESKILVAPVGIITVGVLGRGLFVEGLLPINVSPDILAILRIRSAVQTPQKLLFPHDATIKQPLVPIPTIPIVGIAKPCPAVPSGKRLGGSTTFL
jgi:hypothetical protein